MGFRRVRFRSIVLAGQADPGTVGRPMELFLDTLRNAGVTMDDEHLAVVQDPTLSVEDRVRAAVDLVACITEGSDGLIVFEDLHWADDESLTVLEHLRSEEHTSELQSLMRTS